MHPHSQIEANLNLDSKEFKALFKTKPYIHVVALIFNWTIIALTIFLAVSYPTFWTYFLAVLIIGARMHALAILMHDATHFRFLKNRKWNDIITNYSCMYLIFTSIEKYRQNHLNHHRNLNTEEDPDWVAKIGKREFIFPKTKAEFMVTLCSYLVLYQGISDALWFLKRFGNIKEKKSAQRENKIAKTVFYFLLFGGLTFFGIWKYFLLFWIIPYLSTFFMFQYIRSVAEHFGELEYDDDLTSSRTVVTNAFERFLIAPHNVGYHLEHHLYPAVPFYNLPKLHRLLMEGKAFNSKAHITKGYFTGLMQELGKAG